MAVDNIIKFHVGSNVVTDLEALLESAKRGEILGLCGYAVFPNGNVVSINTDHGVVNNGCVAYCSVLLARQVGDDSDE